MYENNKWYTRIKKFFLEGYYTEQDVLVFVPRYITREEYESIIILA